MGKRPPPAEPEASHPHHARQRKRSTLRTRKTIRTTRKSSSSLSCKTTSVVTGAVVMMVGTLMGCYHPVSGFRPLEKKYYNVGRHPSLRTVSNHPTAPSTCALLLHDQPRRRTRIDRINVGSPLYASGGRNSNSTQEEEQEKEQRQDPSLLSLPISFEMVNYDGGLLACDFFTILIACQLMGLVDAVNDPDFTKNGGWFQPIPAIPPTLGILINRIGLFTFLWFPISLLRIRPPPTTTTSPMIVREGRDSTMISLDLPQTILLFSVIRIVLAVIVTVAAAQGQWESSIGYALRDCYFVGLAMIAFRELYRRYFGDGEGG